MGLFLGIDTSCYTTSVACVDEKGIVYEKRTVLSVKLGQRGLRQSEGLFQHVRNLESLLPGMLACLDRSQIRGIGVSSRPRPEADSYMPVFLAGRMAAASLGAGLGLTPYHTSHQQGHVRAAMLGNEALLEQLPILGMHISGGTTEIFTVDAGLSIRLLGGTEDLHAGQLVDRLGVAMGLPFPAGVHLEAVARAAGDTNIKLPASVKELRCSFSGVETAARSLLGKAQMGELALAVYDCLARTFTKLIVQAADKTGRNRILLAGGVASSGLLREMLQERLEKADIDLYFGDPALSTDNAVGVALLTRDRILQEANGWDRS